MASICQLLNLPEILDRRHISLAQNQSSPSVPFQKRTLFERSTTLRDDRCCSHAYMLPRYEHTHFLPQYWSGQNRTSRTACAGPVPGHLTASGRLLLERGGSIDNKHRRSSTISFFRKRRFFVGGSLPASYWTAVQCCHPFLALLHCPHAKYTTARRITTSLKRNYVTIITLSLEFPRWNERAA